MIDATLGQVDPATQQPVRVRGLMVASGPGTYRLELSLDDGRAGVRQLEGSSCEELSEAAALVIAMAIDPRLLERLEVEPTPEPTPPANPAALPEPTEPEVVEPPESTPEPTPTDATERDPSASTVDDPHVASEPPTSSAADLGLAFLARFDGGVAGGPLPGAAGIVSLGAGLGGRGWRVELTGSYWAPRTRRSESNPDIGVRAQLWTVGVLGCGEPQVGPLTFPLCAGVLAGATHAIGVGDLVGDRVAARWVAAAIEPGVVWWTRPRLGIALRARGHVALARPQLRTDPSGPLFEGSSVGGSLRVGLELRLP